MDENQQTTPAPGTAPEVVQPQPPAPIESGQAEGPNTRKLLIIGGAVLIVILAAGVGVLGYQNFKAGQQTPTPTPTTASEIPPAPPPVPREPASDETANWKTYTNTKASFQVKYPPRYPKPGLPSGAPGSSPIYADENSEGDIIFGETSTDSFSIVVFPFRGSVQKLLTSSEAKGRPPYNWVPSDDILLTSKDVMIDEVNAKWLTASYRTGVKDTYTAIFLTKGDYGFIINPSPNHDEKEINQILSTFKFTQ